MPKLKRQLTFETPFGFYVVDELIGEGGAGRVFGGVSTDHAKVALKVLADERASRDKRGRFKNETAFLLRNKHPNIVSVVDHGLSRGQEVNGPFYVMPRYDGSLRDWMREGLRSGQVLPLFSQILDGVEAAHLQRAIHRDLKPENILHDRGNGRLAIADFGIAQFNEDLVATLVETAPSQRLANFQYAAPEQRTTGQTVAQQTDIYALGLILNELFTGVVPHGTQYRLIGTVDKDFAFLDPLVQKMLAQSPTERPGTIGEVKGIIQRYQAEAVSLQRISKIDGSVIKSNEIDDPLALEPPRLVGADWDRGRLTLTLDRPITGQWVEALMNMSGFSGVMGKPPMSFTFKGNQASVSAGEHEVQALIDHFKNWLPNATQTLKSRINSEAQRREAQLRGQLQREREEEERRLRVLRNIRI